MSVHSLWDEIHVLRDVSAHSFRIHLATADQQPDIHPGLADWDYDPDGQEVNVGAHRAIEDLRRARWVRAEAQQMVEAAIIAAREHGASWTSVGTALGTTRSGAWQRYHHIAP